MKAPLWMVSIRYAAEGVRDFTRRAVVGPACASTVEAALRLAGVPESVCAEIRSNPTVRSFVEGGLDAAGHGYYVPDPLPSSSSWLVCLGPVHEVMPEEARRGLS